MCPVLEAPYNLTSSKVTRHRSEAQVILARFLRVSVFIAGIWAALPLQAEERPAPELTIRMYNAFGVSSKDILAAQETAGRILQTAGVRANWRECWRDAGIARGGMRVCADTLHATEVIVRIVAGRPEHQNGRMGLGYSLVVAPSGAATLATVFGNRVSELAQRVHVEPTTLLGRAIAHEVGHLLLGIDDHTSDGLMRAHWSDVALHEGADRWRFSATEADHIRAEVLARNGPRADLLTASASISGNTDRLDDSPDE
jgi:hypothetical protein